MANFSKALEGTAAAVAADEANVIYPTIEVSFTAPDGGTTTIKIKPEQIRQEPFQMPGPAQLDLASPEANVMHLFQEDYGDGSLILLDTDDPQFEEKSQALRESDRRFDKSAGGWVRKK